MASDPQAGQRLDAAAIQAHLDQLTKPPGSLGHLERLAARLCEIQGTLAPVTTPRALVIFAGDHGVVQSGVSSWPSDVTGLMIRNILDGGAASSVLARTSDTALHLIDVGSQFPRQAVQDGYAYRNVRQGTRDLAHEPALSVDEWRAALEVGADAARTLAADGVRVAAAGEMGIGNTTPASCLAALLLDLPTEELVGRGAGADDAVLARKQEVVEQAVARVRPLYQESPETAIAAVGGLEIAAMAGFFMAGRQAGLTLVLDGVIATAAALAAERLQPGTAEALIAAHRSVEPAHDAMLERLGLQPFLDWQLRLGEGTGALLLLPMLDHAAALVGQMATFADLGIGTG